MRKELNHIFILIALCLSILYLRAEIKINNLEDDLKYAQNCYELTTNRLLMLETQVSQSVDAMNEAASHCENLASAIIGW